MKNHVLPIVIVLLVLAQMTYGQNDNETCLSCHADSELEGLNRHDETITMYVAEQDLESSVHAEMDCIDCHVDLSEVEDYPHPEKLDDVNCITCHSEIGDIFDKSTHGQAGEGKNKPACKNCHGKHRILSSTNPESKTSAQNLPRTCSSCHQKKVSTDDPDLIFIDPYERYMKSIHAKGISQGRGSLASCNDCHGIHDLKKSSDPDSKVNHKNIPKTCSKCHGDIYIKYERGIHGKALAAGIADSPNCADCHGEHEILKIDDPTSPVNASNLSDYVCGKCHNDQRLIDKYNLSDRRFSSYQDSYHGLALKGGSVKAANCISCHNAHDILPQTNPASSIYPDNLPHTCQKCHPRANHEFALSYSHNLSNHKYGTANRTVEIIYIFLIVVVISGMLIHNGIIFFYFIRQRYRINRAQPQIRRFNGNMVYQHTVLMMSFIVLAITGFALRYPETWWVSILNHGGISELSRSIIHRIAATLLLYISVHHLLFLLFSRLGRTEFRAIMPSRVDLKQAIQNIKFHLGLAKTKPVFDRFDYTEKTEYWALVWGTVLMAMTGFILWFPTFFTSFMPSWVVKISETIHFYEAWLATLAIGVFHIFFTVFHPERYPMSFIWIDGNIPKEEVRYHHPLWYDRIEAEDKKKQTELKRHDQEEQE